jgi:hypothetical protein
VSLLVSWHVYHPLAQILVGRAVADKAVSDVGIAHDDTIM